MKKLLLVITLFSSGIAGAQTLTKKAVFTKGQQLEKATVLNMSMTMDMMGQSLEVKNDQTQLSLVEVKDATEKEYTLANTVKRVTMASSAMGQQMNYDSDKKEDADSELGKALGGKVGKTSSIKIDKKGIITASDDTSNNEIATAMQGMMPANVDMKNGGVGGNYELVALLPEKSLKVGDTWVDSTSDKDGKQIMNFRVVDIKATDAVVAVSGIMDRAGEVQQGGMTINMTMSGKTKGEYTLDPTTGIVKKRKLEVDGSGTMEMMGQSVPFTMKMNTEETITKK